MQAVSIIILTFIVTSMYISFLFLTLFFKNKKKLYKEPTSKDKPKLSAIIPAFNEHETIARTIKAIKRTTYSNLIEILVMNDGSTDDTAKIAKQFSGVTVITKEHSGKADSINQGLKIAKGEFIAVVDADSSPAKDAFSKMIPYFRNKKVGAVTSSLRSKNPENLLQKLQHIEYLMGSWGRKLLEYINGIYVTPGPLSMYRKKALLDIGGFDVRNVTEDLEVTWNLLKHKYKVKMCLSAKTYTTTHKKLGDWWNQRIRWNVGALQTMYKYRGTVFRKSSGILGFFVAPFLIVFNIVSLLGFLTLIYLTWKNVFSYFLYLRNASAAQINLFNFELSFLPNIFSLFMTFLMLLSILYVYLGLSTLKENNKKETPFFAYVVYVLGYLTMFPAVTIHSIFRLVTNKYQW